MKTTISMALLCGALSASGSILAAEPAAKLAECRLPGVEMPLRCGNVRVPGLSPPECLDLVAAGFFARGNVEGVDYSCMQEVSPPPFVLGEDGSDS